MARLRFSLGKAVVVKQPSREIKVNKGELILIESSQKRASLKFGVLEDIITWRGKERIVMKQTYHLNQPETLGGITIPIFNPTYYRPECYATQRIKEVYIGKEEIANRLRLLEGMEIYADFIERLEKPYIRE